MTDTTVPLSATAWALRIRSEIDAFLATHEPPSERSVLTVMHPEWSPSTATVGRGGAIIEWVPCALARMMLSHAIEEGHPVVDLYDSVGEGAGPLRRYVLVMAPGNLSLLTAVASPVGWLRLETPPPPEGEALAARALRVRTLVEEAIRPGVGGTESLRGPDGRPVVNIDQSFWPQPVGPAGTGIAGLRAWLTDIINRALDAEDAARGGA